MLIPSSLVSIEVGWIIRVSQVLTMGELPGSRSEERTSLRTPGPRSTAVLAISPSGSLFTDAMNPSSISPCPPMPQSRTRSRTIFGNLIIRDTCKVTIVCGAFGGSFPLLCGRLSQAAGLTAARALRLAWDMCGVLNLLAGASVTSEPILGHK